jgi:hypothetical protein
MAKASTALSFKLWREEIGISMREAAVLLGKKPKTIEHYRDGHRNVPPTTQCLMQALSTGWRPTLIEHPIKPRSPKANAELGVPSSHSAN